MITVGAGEGGQRLDRWLRSRYPNLKQGKLQKLLRTGQVRLDGARAKAGDRVSEGQEVRIPPNIDVDETAKGEGGSGRSGAIGGRMDMAKAASLGDDLKDRILYQDERAQNIHGDGPKWKAVPEHRAYGGHHGKAPDRADGATHGHKK